MAMTTKEWIIIAASGKLQPYQQMPWDMSRRLTKPVESRYSVKHKLHTLHLVLGPKDRRVVGHRGGFTYISSPHPF